MNNKIIKYLTIATLVTSLSWGYIEKTEKNKYKSLYEEKMIENLDLKIKKSYLMKDNRYLMNENITQKFNNCYLKLDITRLEIKEKLNKIKLKILYSWSLLEEKINNEKEDYILNIDSLNKGKNY